MRVFTTDIDAEGNAAITPDNVQKLLGENLLLDASRVEVFPSTVLEAMGLSAYLHEAYGVPIEDLRGQAAALDAMKGLVILVSSSAFKGQTVTLDPKPGVRFVAAFAEPAKAPPVTMTAPDSAEGTLSPKGQPAPLETRSGNTRPLVLLALLIAASLVLFLVL